MISKGKSETLPLLISVSSFLHPKPYFLSLRNLLPLLSDTQGAVSHRNFDAATCNGIFSAGTVFPVIYFAHLPKWLKERGRNRVEFGKEAVQ